jgi:LacI family transcriptional regulator
LAGQRTNIIGLVIAEPSKSLFTDPYFSSVIQGVTQATNQYNQTLSLFLFHTKEDEVRLSNKILNSQMVDGVVITGAYMDDPLIPKLIESDLPFVMIGYHDDSRVNLIDSDNMTGAQTAVTYLIRLGYERIGHITGHMNNQAALKRLDGYTNALKKAGREVEEELIVTGDYTELSGFEAMKSLLEQGVDAVFAASDSMAVGAIRAVQAAGLSVPEDVAIIGFDDLPVAIRSEPQLTTIRQPIRRAGSMAVEMLLDILDNGPEPVRRKTLPIELVVGESCGGTLL